jgi:hypothetical protein
MKEIMDRYNETRDAKFNASFYKKHYNVSVREGNYLLKHKCLSCDAAIASLPCQFCQPEEERQKRYEAARKEAAVLAQNRVEREANYEKERQERLQEAKPSYLNDCVWYVGSLIFSPMGIYVYLPGSLLALRLLIELFNMEPLL